MFGRRKKKEEAHQREVEQNKQVLIQSCHHGFEQARALKDPAERFLALKDHRKAMAKIEESILSGPRARIEKIKKRRKRVGMAGGAILTGTVCVLTHGFGFLFMGPLNVAGARNIGKQTAAIAEININEKLQREMGPVLETIGGLKVETDMLCDQILKTESQKVVASRAFKKVQRDLPKFAEEFRRAALIEKHDQSPKPKKPPRRSLP